MGGKSQTRSHLTRTFSLRHDEIVLLVFYLTPLQMYPPLVAARLSLPKKEKIALTLSVNVTSLYCPVSKDRDYITTPLAMLHRPNDSYTVNSWCIVDPVTYRPP